MLDLATNPGIKNFFFTLLVWIGGVAVVAATGANLPFLKVFLFYAKWSWPNFFLFYTMVIWVFPLGMTRKGIPKAILYGILTLTGFIVVRYLNNVYWDADYYVGYTSKNVKYMKGWTEIVANEVFKWLQVSSMALMYRLFLERIIILKDKKALEVAKAEAELSALRHQLNPHFLFNSLNSIYYLSMKKSDRTPEALLKLSELLRYVLNQKDEWVSIDKELEYIENMISFERIRFPEGYININVDIVPSRRRMMMPAMLLTPLVENAFKHGDIGSEERPLVIRLDLTRDKLSFMVVNPVDDKQSESGRNGIGLENLKRRLELLYKGKYLLDLKEVDKYFFAKLEIQLDT